MANWVNRGRTLGADVRSDRIAAGTVGGEHVVQSGIPGKKVSAIIDDTDPRITYGLVSGYGSSVANFTVSATTDWQFGGTYTVIGGTSSNGTPGSGALFRFTGSSITVLGGTNVNSGTMRVYIDGVETKGRIPIYCGFRIAGTTGQSVISASDTTIPAFANSGSFASAGTLYINGELITYTSKDANGFYGCTRGTSNTVAVAHNANETIYQWDSSIGLYSARDFGSKQILYHNPLLSNGDHSIIIIAETNATSGKARIYFDGFATGSLLGASNIFTQIATLTVDCTTDGNGHQDLGGIVAQNNDIARLALIGVTQSSTEATNTTNMVKVGLKYPSGVDYQPYLYIHNGPLSASFTITLTFAFIGETL